MYEPDLPLGRIGGLAAVLVLLLSTASCKDGNAEVEKAATDEVTAIPVEVQGIERGDVAAVYSGTAAMEPEHEAEVVAKVTGQVMALRVEEGQHVKAGDLLARLDGDRLRLQVQRARANLAKLERDLSRQRELQAKGLVSNESIERAEYDIASLKADLDLAELDLSYTEIRSPFDGVITQRHIKVGNTVNVNDPLFHLTDLDPLVAYLHVPEREFSKLHPGQEAQLRVDALTGQQFSGHIARISPVIDAATGTFKVTVEASDSSGALKPGMFARFEVVYDMRRDAILIPRAAIVEDEANQTVFIVQDEVAHRRTIRTGLTNGPMIEVLEGLEGDESIVTIGQSGLRDGGKVRVVGADTPNTAPTRG
jgi:membrane fusion protein, multidrug efflux system